MREEENGKQTKQKMVNQINTLTRNIIDDDVNDEENQTGDDRVKVVHNQNCFFLFFSLQLSISCLHTLHDKEDKIME